MLKLLIVTVEQDLRDKAMVLLFVESGLRLSELCSLNKNTIATRKRAAPDGTTQYFGQGEVLGKGRKRRKFIVGPTALQALADYIKAQRLKDSNPALFLSSRHKRISGRTVQHTLDILHNQDVRWHESVVKESRGWEADLDDLLASDSDCVPSPLDL